MLAEKKEKIMNIFCSIRWQVSKKVGETKKSCKEIRVVNKQHYDKFSWQNEI